MIAGLVVVLLVVLAGPVLIKPIERNIELFFLFAGALAAALGGQLGWPLLKTAAVEPFALTAAVLVFGALARVMRNTLDRGVETLLAHMSAQSLYFLLIVVLGLLSSVITAVVAALILVEAISLLRLDRGSEVVAVVLACFAIGLGAALTPVGEPLGTVAIAALHADFWYLVRLVGPFVLAGIFVVGLLSLAVPVKHGGSLDAKHEQQSWSEVGMRACKVYLFVAGLVGLSWGLRPLVDLFISRMPGSILFWLNGISAVVDNATLTAAEIGPALTHAQQRSILMGLLISGGMLVPGNIPNIVAAGRLGITSREWARVGLITGLPLMLLCFMALRWIG